MATVDNSRLERDGSLSRNGTNNGSAERSRASGSNGRDGRVNLENIILCTNPTRIFKARTRQNWYSIA